MSDEHLMPPAERAAYANGYDDHQRLVNALLGKVFSVMPVDEYISYLRDVLIKFDVAPACIAKLDDVETHIESLYQEIDDLKDALAHPKEPRGLW